MGLVISALIFHAIAPVCEKEFFLGGQKGVRPAEQRAQGRAHLQNDQNKNDRPGFQTGPAAGIGLAKAGIQEPQAKSRGHKPKHQM